MRRVGDALRGEVAIVTGGASGIGHATCLLFGAEGASVGVVDIDGAAAEQGAQRIVELGGRAVAVQADVAQSADCRRSVEQVHRALGPVTVLFNNAGIVRRTSILDISEEEWDRVMAVNVKSVFLMSREVIPSMVKAGRGSIVNAGSGWGLTGGPNAVSYCASKGAVVQLTRAMAIDHGAHNIRVNCLCPGDTDTGMLRAEAVQLGESEQRFLTQAADRPLRRIGRPEDIAQAALYLAGDASAFVTGTTLVVDGGGLAG